MDELVIRAFSVGIALFAVLATVSIVVYAIRLGITPNPSSPKATRAICSLLPPARPNGLDGPIYELGSGFGTLALALAKTAPDRQIVAFELSPLPWAISRMLRAVLGVSNLTIHRQDFSEADLHDAAAVVCYLYPEGMAELAPKLARELRPGAWVVSHAFRLPGWTPIRVEPLRDAFRTEVYVYERPGGGRPKKTIPTSTSDV